MSTTLEFFTVIRWRARFGQSYDKVVLWKNGGSLIKKRILLRPAVNSRMGLKIQEKLELERHRTEAEHSEGQRAMASKAKASEQPLNQAHPDDNAVEAIFFRREDGTLDPVLSTFRIKSGILASGQMLSMYYG